MSVTGNSINKDITSLKKDVSELKSSVTTHANLLLALSEVSNSIPYVGNYVFKLWNNDLGSGAFEQRLTKLRSNGPGDNITGVGMNSAPTYSLYLDYTIPEYLRSSSYSADKLRVIPSTLSSNALTLKLEVFEGVYFETCHMESKVTKLSDTTCRFEISFLRHDTYINVLSDHLSELTSRLDIDVLIIDFNKN